MPPPSQPTSDSFLNTVRRHLRGVEEQKQEELLRELADHIEDARKEWEASGMSPDSAQERAVAEMGNPTAVGSRLRAARLAHGAGSYPYAGWALWCWWIFAGALGNACGLVATLLAIAATLRTVPGAHEDKLVLYFLMPLLGASIGLTQSLVLRKHIPHPWRWVLATLAGWSSGILILLLEPFRSTLASGAPALSMALTYALFGAMVSIVQWPILRAHVPNAGLWVLAGALGWFVLGSTIDGKSIDGVFGMVGIWLFPCGVTGLVLVLLLRRRVSTCRGAAPVT